MSVRFINRIIKILLSRDSDNDKLMKIICLFDCPLADNILYHTYLQETMQETMIVENGTVTFIYKEW